MSLHQVNSAFNLLGQTHEPAESVHLPGPISPTLSVSWGAFRQSLASNVRVVFSGPSYAKNYIYSGFFKDCWIEGRIPRIALLVALALHVAVMLVPFPRSLTAVHRNPAFENTELTWSGPVNDLPLLNLSSLHAKPAPRSKAAAESPSAPPEPPAFHPRQRIFTDSAHPTHPRQTLINPAAPMEPPKILPALPNIVQLQQSAGPAKPRVQIDPQALAQLRPRERRAATSAVAPPTDVPVFQQQQADLTIQASPNGPARPKLALNAGAAPRLAPRAQSGDPAAPPELADARPATAAGGGSASTLIALSTAPAPPAANIPAPQGNLAARMAISPEGQPGATGGSPANSVAREKSGSASPTGTSPVTVSISGGNPVPKSTVSGLGGTPGSVAAGNAKNTTAKLILSSPHDMLTHRPTQAESDETQVRTGPPNFTALPPGAKPETVFLAKKIYTLFVNMPNLNSATGSWILNFSELRTDGGAAHLTPSNLAAPVPTKKVDPKYPPTLAADHVEGEIVLYGVIRRDGSIDSIQLVHGLDEQLDANSMSALSQWKFRPATREDAPVELEAIVHIPFHTVVPQ
jgi:TonB family protein